MKNNVNRNNKNLSDSRRPLGSKGLLAKVIFLLLIIGSSCDELLDIKNPKEKIGTKEVYSTDVTAVSAMAGIYYDLISISSFANGFSQSVTALAGLSADEIVSFGDPSGIPERYAFYKNNISSENPIISSLWKSLYKSIYQSNAMIEQLEKSTSVSESIKRQLKGEALFIRAFCNFYAVNMFGDVPLIVTTDFRINAAVSRTQNVIIYQQIVSDLLEAKSLLAEEYVAGLSQTSGDRVRVNRYAAAALLARAYLYTQNWTLAESEATSILERTDLYELNTDLDKVFLACTNSNLNKEAIWQLMPTNTQGVNTWEGNIFIFPAGIYTLTDQLYNAFLTSDSRQTKWIGTFNSHLGVVYFPYKYKIKTSSAATEYSMVLRLAEQYLIRAEARIRQNNIIGAQQDINVIRHRASLENTLADNQDVLLQAIEDERRIELFSEWGHRWFDLKRWNRADAVLGPIKGVTWNATDVLYPLPQGEISKNANLKPQNIGY